MLIIIDNNLKSYNNSSNIYDFYKDLPTNKCRKSISKKKRRICNKSRNKNKRTHLK